MQLTLAAYLLPYLFTRWSNLRSSSAPADYVPAGHVIISADRYSEYADLSYR
ncbi:hypothetical protein Tco_0786628, partial [Tanacetum coccineum]